MKKRLLSCFAAVLVVLTLVTASAFAYNTSELIYEAVSVTAEQGGTVKVDILVTQNPGFALANFSVSWDADALTLTDCSAVSKFQSGKSDFSETVFTPVKQAAEAGKMEFLLGTPDLYDDGYSNYTATGKLATLTFKVKRSTAVGDYTITLGEDKSDFYANDADTGENVKVDASPSNGTLTVEPNSLGENVYEVGDVNRDGYVDLLDVTLLARYVAEWDGYGMQIDLDLANIDGEGEIDLLDVTILARYVAEWDGYDKYIVPKAVGAEPRHDETV